MIRQAPPDALPVMAIPIKSKRHLMLLPLSSTVPSLPRAPLLVATQFGRRHPEGPAGNRAFGESASPARAYAHAHSLGETNPPLRCL